MNIYIYIYIHNMYIYKNKYGSNSKLLFTFTDVNSLMYEP